MPFTLCKSERRKLDELVDQVKELSDTLDELKAEVEAMKICPNIASNESLNERRNRVDCSPLHKLKRCFQKSIIPVFSPTYKVRKKCQEMFSQMPTIISRPTNLPSNKHPNYQHFPSSSYTKTDRRSLKSKTPNTIYLDKTKSKRREETSSQRRKNITKDSQNPEQVEISSSSSQRSKDYIKEPHRAYNPSCTYETCNSLKSSRKNENIEQFRRNAVKKKTTEAATATTTSSPIRIVTPKRRLIDTETIQRQRSVTFVDREKKIPLEKGSSMSSSFSSSNKDYNVIHGKPNTEHNLKRTINSAPTASEVKKKKKKISRSAQCSIDCEYFNKLPVDLKNINTLPYNLSPENKNVVTQNIKKTRRKDLASQGTQTTSKLEKYTGEMCSNGRRRYCPKARRSCFSAESQSSLTSCSPKSISSFCLGSEELGEGLMYRYSKREPISEKEKLKKKHKAKIMEEEINNAKKTKRFSSREAEKKGAKAISTKSRSNRRKRTYLISSDVPVKKSDEIGQCNLDEEQTNFSSNGISKFEKRELKQPKIRRKFKEYDELSKVEEDQQLWNKQQSSSDKHDNYMLTSVCRNNRREKFVPKFERRSNWTIQRRHKNPNRLTEKRENTSSSSQICTDETCSLTSDIQFNISDESVNSDHFNTNEKPTNNFDRFVRR